MEQSRQGLLATPKAKQKMGQLVKVGAVEKGVKVSSDYKASVGAQAQTIEVTNKEGAGAQI